MFYAYIIKSQSQKNDKWYTGSTNDLQKHLKQHNDNRLTYTKGQSPWGLIYYEAYLNDEDSRSREKYLKFNMGKRYLKIHLRHFLSLTR